MGWKEPLWKGGSAHVCQTSTLWTLLGSLVASNVATFLLKDKTCRWNKALHVAHLTLCLVNRPTGWSPELYFLHWFIEERGSFFSFFFSLTTSLLSKSLAEIAGVWLLWFGVQPLMFAYLLHEPCDDKLHSAHTVHTVVVPGCDKIMYSANETFPFWLLTPLTTTAYYDELADISPLSYSFPICGFIIGEKKKEERCSFVCYGSHLVQYICVFNVWIKYLFCFNFICM